MRKMIAKSKKGAEFMYKRHECYLAPNASAEKICTIMNQLNYKLHDGEIWHVHDCGPYEMEYTSAGYQKIAMRKGHIYSTGY